MSNFKWIVNEPSSVCDLLIQNLCQSSTKPDPICSCYKYVLCTSDKLFITANVETINMWKSSFWLMVWVVAVHDWLAVLLLAYGKGVHYDEKTHWAKLCTSCPRSNLPARNQAAEGWWAVREDSETDSGAVKALTDYRRKEMTDANEQNAQTVYWSSVRINKKEEWLPDWGKESRESTG